MFCLLHGTYRVPVIEAVLARLVSWGATRRVDPPGTEIPRLGDARRQFPVRREHTRTFDALLSAAADDAETL